MANQDGTSDGTQETPADILSAFSDALGALLDNPEALADPRVRGFRNDLRSMAHGFNLQDKLTPKHLVENGSPGKTAAKEAHTAAQEKASGPAV